MVLPNFLIIGASKSGTTSLYEYLRQHPQVYMSPIKETNFFAFDSERPCERIWGEPKRKDFPFPVKVLEAYQALFEGVTQETAIGEASPLYLESTTAPYRIREVLPDVKLVATLRNPVERAISNYWMAVRHGDKRNVGEILKPDGGAVQAGRYHAMLKRYFDLFGARRIKVILFDDLRESPVETIQDLYCFLSVDDSFVPDVGVRHNVGGVPRKRVLHAVLASRRLRSISHSIVPVRVRKIARMLRARNLRPYPPLPREMRFELFQFYREDILQLQDLIARDLSAWLWETGS